MPYTSNFIARIKEQPTGQFARQPDWQFPAGDIKALLNEAAGGQVEQVDATRLATALCGDAMATNLFMLGFVCQKGWLPLSEQALVRAIELNGVAVEANRKAFTWGRRTAVDPQAVKDFVSPPQPLVFKRNDSLDDILRFRVEWLTAYQNAAYATRYADQVQQVREAEAKLGQGERLSRAVALSLFKLMAYKDEYEVSRLYTNGSFMAELKQQFDGHLRLRLNLANCTALAATASDRIRLDRLLEMKAKWREIDLSGCGLSQLPPKAFEKMPNLCDLDLSNNRLKEFRLKHNPFWRLDLSENGFCHERFLPGKHVLFFRCLPYFIAPQLSSGLCLKTSKSHHFK
ncbi:MAG: hypothetical protein EB038_00770 [Cyclobacteriaceae bacterium]|nr:hypothetical protein [Cyclobacteriaceae bacterium]